MKNKFKLIAVALIAAASFSLIAAPQIGVNGTLIPWATTNTYQVYGETANTNLLTPSPNAYFDLSSASDAYIQCTAIMPNSSTNTNTITVAFASSVDFTYWTNSFVPSLTFTSMPATTNTVTQVVVAQRCPPGLALRSISCAATNGGATGGTNTLYLKVVPKKGI